MSNTTKPSKLEQATELVLEMSLDEIKDLALIVRRKMISEDNLQKLKENYAKACTLHQAQHG